MSGLIADLPHRDSGAIQWRLESRTVVVPRVSSAMPIPISPPSLSPGKVISETKEGGTPILARRLASFSVRSLLSIGAWRGSAEIPTVGQSSAQKEEEMEEGWDGG
ncbi:MAG: hypothetical protein ACK41W_07650 [Cyanobacteriota bacterium]|jgi:hypothetical protein